MAGIRKRWIIYGWIAVFLFTIGFSQKESSAFSTYSEAEKAGKENSFRYEEGERKKVSSTKKAVTSENVTIIDVSHHQGKIDWLQVKDAGIEAVIIHCGYGQDTDENGDYTQDDAYFKYNVSECERLGISYGIYLYSYAKDTTAAQREADHVVRLIKEVRQQEGVLSFFTYPIFYDMEDYSLESLKASTFSANATAFINRMKESGYDNIGFYSNKDWFEKRLTGTIFSLYPKWVAQYNSQCTYEGKYRLWQYTDQALVNGIDGTVDANQKHGSWEANLQVSQVTLNKKSAVITVGSSITVKATISPSGVINPYVAWKSSSTAVASVNSTGKITGKKPGTAAITAVSHNGKKASISITVKPKSNRITSLKKSGSNSIKISWSKVSGVTGYQIYMSTKKDSGYKRIRTTSSSVSSYTKSGLKKGRRYYFKVRSYKKAGSKYIYSNYSAVKYLTR